MKHDNVTMHDFFCGIGFKMGYIVMMPPSLHHVLMMQLEI
jgi:hypothetical protein